MSATKRSARRILKFFCIFQNLLRDEYNFNRLIISRIHTHYDLYFTYFCSVDSLLEMHLSHFKLIVLLLDQLFMMRFILFVVFEWLLYSLHLDPFFQAIDHLDILLANLLQKFLFCLQNCIKLTQIVIAFLKNRLQLSSFSLSKSFILPNRDDSFSLSQSLFKDTKVNKHLLQLLVSELVHYIEVIVLMMSQNCCKLMGNLISLELLNLCMSFLTY